jgi:16S rRNA A1518/A1519 N6-dimethyltransferase RsmA/KsgA/DIM1 with predicted DNA glycosylase/AP lyase activity
MLHHAVNRHAPGAVEEISHQTGIDLKRRAETLTLEEFAELANAIYDFNRQD